MTNIPSDIDIEKLPGPNRGDSPALYFRDEIIWSPQKQYFTLAYTIIEASYGNSVGHILWGMYDGKNSKIFGNPKDMAASCWKQPWCKWLDDNSFVFKAQKYYGKSTYVPLVIVHVDKGFAVLPGSNDTNKWLDEILEYDGIYQSYDEQSLIEAVVNIK
jgi:hypothetical protein